MGKTVINNSLYLKIVKKILIENNVVTQRIAQPSPSSLVLSQLQQGSYLHQSSGVGWVGKREGESLFYFILKFCFTIAFERMK